MNRIMRLPYKRPVEQMPKKIKPCQWDEHSLWASAWGAGWMRYLWPVPASATEGPIHSRTLREEQSISSHSKGWPPQLPPPWLRDGQPDCSAHRQGLPEEGSRWQGAPGSVRKRWSLVPTLHLAHPRALIPQLTPHCRMWWGL